MQFKLIRSGKKPYKQFKTKAKKDASASVYVLELSNGKYYVGKTTRKVATRFAEHQKGDGCSWTKLHPPLRILRVVENADIFDEDKHVMLAMHEFGVENVRGGSYSQLSLSAEQVASLQKNLRSAQDTCFRCGRPSHFASACYAKTHADGTPIEENESLKSPAPTTTAPPTPTPSITPSDKCARCGRSGHTSEKCYAKKHAMGAELDTRQQQSPASTDSLSSGNCSRCGRSGHLATDCYAQKHSDGALLLKRPRPPVTDKRPLKVARVESTLPSPMMNDLAFGILKNMNDSIEQMKAQIAAQSAQLSTNEGGTCARCGRRGHISDRCFAKTHANGAKIS